MGMSPGQDPPKFHLISVPIVQCKPPTYHVLSSELSSGRPTDCEHANTTAHLFQPNSRSRPAEEQSCHSSYPAIPQHCLEHAQALLDPRERTEFHAQYFNTIPLKSKYQRKLIEQSPMAYREQPPPYKPMRDPSTVNGNKVRLNKSSAVDLSEYVAHEIITSQDNRDPPQDKESSDLSVNNQKSPSFTNKQSESEHSANPGDEHSTIQSSCSKETHWMEQYLDELYSRKQWLTQALTEAEVSLKRLMCEEKAITGIWPSGNLANVKGKPRSGSHTSLTETSESIGRGIHDVESRASSLMNRLKWRQSRRSKSAHERLPTGYSQTTGNGLLPQSTEMQLRRARVGTDPSGLQSEINGSITVVRGNEERSDVTVPRRLLRWWRQNKRRSVLDAKRRQSMGFMSMHCPDPATGLPPMELRTRGSSMPPNETRAEESIDQERLTGHSSNRASLRLHHNPFSDCAPGTLPTTSAVIDQQGVRSRFSSVAGGCSYTSHPPNYQFVQLLTSNVTGNNANEITRNLFLPPNQRIHFLPCHQIMADPHPTSTNNNNSKSNDGGKVDQSVLPNTTFGKPVYRNHGINELHLYPSMVEAQMGPVHLYEYTNFSGKGPPSRWTTVRCRPMHPGTATDKSSSPPPLPPRVCGIGAGVEPMQNAVLVNTRHQMQHYRVPHATDWTRSGVTVLDDGSATITERYGEQRMNRREISSSNGPIITTVKLAPHFQPIIQRTSNSKQSKRWNPTQPQFTAVPKPSGVNGRARFPSLGNTVSSRIINGYEICPQVTALTSRRVHSASVRPSAWDHVRGDTVRNPFVEPLWQLHLGTKQYGDNMFVKITRSNETRKVGRTFSHTVDSPAHKFNGIHQNIGASGPTQGVNSFDDCNAALRECLQGWELSDSGQTQWEHKMDPTTYSAGNSNPRVNPHVDLTKGSHNSKWTRIPGGDSVGAGSRNLPVQSPDYSEHATGSHSRDLPGPSTTTTRWNL